MTKFSNLTLKRGTIAKDTEFYKWIFNEIHSSIRLQRRDITISLLDETHNPL